MKRILPLVAILILVNLILVCETSPPSKSKVAALIMPQTPTVLTPLTCYASVDESSQSLKYQWSRNDVPQPGIAANTVDSSLIHKDETWQCTVTFRNGEHVTTPEVEIRNSPPTAPTIRVELATDGIHCALLTPSMDADQDPVSYKYEWYRDENAVPYFADNFIGNAWLAEGEEWACVVTASDGEDPSIPCEDRVVLNADWASVANSATLEASLSMAMTSDATTATTTATTPSDSAPSSDQSSNGATTSTTVTPSDPTSSTVEPSSGDTTSTTVTPSDPPSSASLPSGSINALYVWGEMYDIIAYESTRANFFSVCASQGINTVWFPIDLDSLRWFDSHPGYPVEQYVSFMTEAQDRGIAIHGMLWSAGGDILLNAGEHEEYVLGVLKYNQEHPGAKFAGLHFDIENCSTGWSDDYFLQAYINYIEELKSWRYNGDTLGSQGMIISAYCDQLQNCSEWYAWIREFDLIEIQAYCDTFDAILTQEYGRAALINEAGIPFIILSELSPESDHVTFWDEGLDYYYAVRADLQEHYAQYSQFRGFGLHHYRTLVELMG